ncbi:DNA-binding domain of Mlu1-box binding protein MBP1 [Aspergillus affinis]|uniref:DNA-binding domain of Mlu1-box binding protein MBP1 n=1 Tax=Aspergillus affinis TaxID=1070780 RepID=UPI0022FF42E3|nr:DNA-binding domain of Mlu1-box binding protein MBP1 [Aspergillus affinis]KAI9045256.1 DNA-binding domain of Mlu1-box binding protein MBP1 [Aspergillus affinis]
MVRSLPKKNNPLILATEAPAYEELLVRRRLGKTNLAVKPTQIGTSNATKPENLGPFEYAHLRAPLPKDLKGSEIFPSHTPQQHPETYFLMRRSKDGFVSATGMFKIAFPWARLDEERLEREYLKSREETSEDEIAGNVWISPILALELAREYQMYDWVRALLDPTDIVQSPSSAKKQITPPPRFDLPPIGTPPQLSAPSLRTRSRRSASPSKRVGSPRKARQTKAMKEASAAATIEANASLQSSLDATADPEPLNGTIQPSVEIDDEKLVLSPAKSAVTSKRPMATPRVKKSSTKPSRRTEEPAEEKVKVEIKTNTDVNADVGDDIKEFQAAQTTVSVEMPISLPEAPSAEDTEKMIAQAKEMVQEAVKQTTEQEPAESSEAAAAKKRKTDVLSEDEEDEETKAASSQRAKRAKVLEERLKRERVRNRALVGVTAAFAFAASIPYFF